MRGHPGDGLQAVGVNPEVGIGDPDGALRRVAQPDQGRGAIARRLVYEPARAAARPASSWPRAAARSPTAGVERSSSASAARRTRGSGARPRSRRKRGSSASPKTRPATCARATGRSAGAREQSTAHALWPRGGGTTTPSHSISGRSSRRIRSVGTRPRSQIAALAAGGIAFATLSRCARGPPPGSRGRSCAGTRHRRARSRSSSTTAARARRRSRSAPSRGSGRP
jgi:hypothetical protein